MKLSPKVYFTPKVNQVHIEDDPDYDPDTGDPDCKKVQLTYLYGRLLCDVVIVLYGCVLFLYTHLYEWMTYRLNI